MNIIIKLLINIINKRIPSVAGKLIGSALLLSVSLLAQGVSAAGLLSPVNGQSPLMLTEQHVSVVIQNGFAVTEVDQIFRNPHALDTQARYSFPVPEEAAVGEFTYWIDGQPVHAEVLEKQAARQLHEQQQQAGQESALVEQDEYRTFEAEVSPVRAGQDVRVRLVYLQRTFVDHAMGRYVYPLEEGGVDEHKDSFWSRNEHVSDAFTFNLKLRSAYPVDAVRVTNGQATISQLDSGEWQISIDSKSGHGAQVGQGLDDREIVARLEADELALPSSQQASSQTHSSTAYSQTQNATAGAAQNNSPAFTLDKDIVVYWRLAENLPGAVDLVTFKEAGASSGTFMLTLTPGIDLAPITEGRDWLFVLDTSGSMRGKFATLVDGVQRSLGALNPTDRFKIILFSDRAQALTPDFVPVNKQSVDRALHQLDGLSAGGGTNLFDGLQKAVKSLDRDRTTAIVLVTDGVANVGPTHMTKFLKLLEKVDVRLFTAVMGNSANRPLLEGLTRYSEGFAVNVSNDDDMVGLMMQMTSKVTHEALHNVRIDIDGVRTRDLTPENFNRVYRGEQMIIMGKYSGSGAGRVSIKAELSGEAKRYESALQFPDSDTDNPELERLWAFASIKALQSQQDIVGETDDTRQGITEIALQHGLVTNYTSLVVVRDEVFEQAGIDRQNARRVERERLARQSRASQSINATRQDAQSPAFPGNRQTVGSGGGSLGVMLLTMLAALAILRIGLGLHDRFFRQVKRPVEPLVEPSVAGDCK